MTAATALNVLGTELDLCSLQPRTGFTRSGCCELSALDAGVHIVCAQVDERFLAFSRNRGNDLTTPMPEAGFPGLEPGNRWCLCLARWLEALEAGCAPRVVLRATHQGVLELVELAVLKKHAIDLS